jgi:hypothetical protein
MTSSSSGGGLSLEALFTAHGYKMPTKGGGEQGRQKDLGWGQGGGQGFRGGGGGRAAVQHKAMAWQARTRCLQGGKARTCGAALPPDPPEVCAARTMDTHDTAAPNMVQPAAAGAIH